MNRRRALLIAIGAGLAATPLLPGAQKPARGVRIGFLGAESAAGYKTNVEAFQAGLREAGYVEGRNIAVEFRWAEGKLDQLPELANQLVRLKVDIIVTHGAPGTHAAKRATTTIPIVMASAGDAVATGLVANLARPEGNVTGSTFFALEVGAKRLDLLREAMPGLTRVAWLFAPDNPITPQARQMIEQAAKTLNVGLEQIGIRAPNELEGAFSAVARKRVDAVLVPEFSLFRSEAGAIARLAIKHRLPTIGFNEFADAGGLIGYGLDDATMYRRAAVFVDKILKGARPGDLPVERATTFQLIVNRKTAKGLGVTIPNSFLVRADKVIE